MIIDAERLDYAQLGEILRETEEPCVIRGCLGQRFIAAGMGERSLSIYGVPGNALGAYMNGARVEVFGNAQDAAGDTMNAGRIIIHGSAGDALGYAMRGGEIYVCGSVGYRAGVHMKAYGDTVPVMVIGGAAGSFLGEYQAGGIIIVLGLGADGPLAGDFPCAGMHGGRVFLRSDCRDIVFPEQVSAREATREDISGISNYIAEYCRLFGADEDGLLSSRFTVVEPDAQNPYRQLYAAN